MSLAATTTFANPDPDANPLTLVEMIALLNTLVETEVPGDYSPYVLGSSTPDVADQDKAWIRTTPGGSPMGTYIFYLGNWVKEAPSVGARNGTFFGDPTAFFDSEGLGLINTEYYGWAIANGNNGTANLSNRFLIFGQMDNVDITGFSGGLWRTNVNGHAETVGGNATITLDDASTYQPAIAELKVGTWDANEGQSREDAGPIYGTVGDPSNPNLVIVDADAGNTTPDAIEISPPFFACALIAWVGYDIY